MVLGPSDRSGGEVPAATIGTDDGKEHRMPPAPQPGPRRLGRAGAPLAQGGPVLPSSLRRILSSREPDPRSVALARAGWSLASAVIVVGALVLWQLLLPGPVGGDLFLGPPVAPTRPHDPGPGSTALIRGAPERALTRAVEDGGRDVGAALIAVSSTAPRAAATRSGSAARSRPSDVRSDRARAAVADRAGPTRDRQGDGADADDSRSGRNLGIGEEGSTDGGPGDGGDRVVDTSGTGLADGRDGRDDDTDNSGRGSADDRDDDTDNSGKGSADDRDDDADNSGKGSAHDRGSGRGEKDDKDDKDDGDHGGDKADREDDHGKDADHDEDADRDRHDSEEHGSGGKSDDRRGGSRDGGSRSSSGDGR